jgi:hypothetical protein
VATRTISAIAGDPKAQVAGKPVPLRAYSDWEKASLVIFFALGIALTVVIVILFAHGIHGKAFLSKEITTEGSGEKQVVKETDYSDTFLIFGLTAAATLVLVAGLYGRLRDITLGKLKLELEE